MKTNDGMANVSRTGGAVGAGRALLVGLAVVVLAGVVSAAERKGGTQGAAKVNVSRQLDVSAPKGTRDTYTVVVRPCDVEPERKPWFWWLGRRPLR